MSLVQINEVGIAFAGESLFADVSFNIDENSRIGLVGRNGCGKTTLLKVITKEIEPSFGNVTFASKTKISYLKQVNTLSVSDTLYQAVLESRSDFVTKQHALQEARELVSDNATDENLDLLSHLEEDFFSIGGYDYETNIKLILTSLGFPETVWEQKIERFSGGERTRIELSKILLSEYNLLLLDEPTNHLDLHMINWLEGYLLNLGKPYIIISHDKLFLDKSVKKIIEIQNRRMHNYSGNYTFFEVESALRKEQQINAFKQQQKYLDETMAFVRKNIGSQKTVQARSRLKKIEKLEIIEDVSKDTRFNLKFDNTARTGNDVFKFEKCSIGFPGKVLASDINLDVDYQDKIAIIGRNGCGKTTLLRIIMQEQDVLKGVFKIGSNIKIGYFDQFHSVLNLSSTPKETIWELAPGEPIGYVLKYLAHYGFRGDEIEKKNEFLSGGEKARLNLAVLIHQQPNVLLLDEPTNHLDILMVEDLIISLNHYKGTIIFVSHDRNFIDKVATKFWLFKENKISNVIDEWATVLERFLKVENPKKDSTAVKKNKENNREKKVNPFILERLLIDIAETEDYIVDLHREKEEIEEAYADPAIYSDIQLVKELKLRMVELDNLIDRTSNKLLILEDEYLILSD